MGQEVADLVRAAPDRAAPWRLIGFLDEDRVLHGQEILGVPVLGGREWVVGRDVAVTPLKTDPGDIWPGPLPPPKTLQDLERQGPSAPEQPVPGSPLSRGRSGNPLTAPLPNGTTGTPPAGEPQPDRRIIVPNGNGTSTVIHPDGRIETIPTPK